MKSTVDAQKLKQLRELKGWSQSQVSEMSQTSIRTIQRIEKEGTGSIETVKSIAAVFDIDFSELLIKSDKHDNRKDRPKNKSFFYEFQKIWFKTPAIFWTMNFSIAFLSGLLFSVFLSTDKEKLILITTCFISEIILWMLFGGYKAAKRKFIERYGADDTNADDANKFGIEGTKE